MRNKIEGCELKVIEGAHVWTLGGKIYVPKSLRGRIIGWYHEYLQHPGQNRMEASIKQTLWWPNVKKDVIHNVRKCHQCQVAKLVKTTKFGKLPEKQATTPIPWNRVDVNMIGPWTVKTKTGIKKEL